jgi:hypothetical protein
LESLVAPGDSGTFEVSRKLVVERILAVCALPLGSGFCQGGVSLAVALLVGVRLASAFCAATAEGDDANWVW